MCSECDQAEPKRILFVALTRFGDMLQATPAIAGLKREHPGCHIAVVIEKNFSAVCEGIPGIDEVIEIDLAYVWQCIQREREALVDAYEYVDRVVEELRAKRFDVCINISSSSYTSVLLKMLNIPDTRGWTADDEGQRLISSPWAMIFAAYVFHGNRDLNSLNVVDTFRCAAGVSQHPRSLQYVVPSTEQDFAQRFFAEEPVQGRGPLIFIQAGASQEKRQWSPAYFAHVCRLLIERLDARIVLTGTKSEQPIAKLVFKCYSSPNMVSAVGKTSIAQLAALLSAGDLLISGDTGTMHLAAAVNLPVVALFLASAFVFETGPYGAGNLALQPQIGCSPCNPNLACARPDCHQQIRPETVAALAELRLNAAADEELSVSTEIADPRDVLVYQSRFDDEGFIDFKPVNGLADKRGISDSHFVAARTGYRDLWKQEFTDYQGTIGERDLPPELERGLTEITRLSESGRNLLTQLASAVRNLSVPAAELSGLSAKLQQIDKDIECLGVSHETFGPIVRMFVMDVQNMRGDDPLDLASKMESIYLALERRIYTFASFYTQRIQELSAVQPQWLASEGQAAATQ